MRTNSKSVLAVGLAAATLALVLANTISGVVLRTGLVPELGIGAIPLAVAALVVSWNQRSFLVAGLLVASGIIGMIPGLIATGYFAAIVFPGPIYGVIYGLGLFGLGAANGIRTTRNATAANAVIR
jgi:flagellar biosynthesis protein FliR